MDGVKYNPILAMVDFPHEEIMKFIVTYRVNNSYSFNIDSIKGMHLTFSWYGLNVIRRPSATIDGMLMALLEYYLLNDSHRLYQ